MREYRSSGSVEGVMSNHDSYSDFVHEVTGTRCRFWGVDVWPRVGKTLQIVRDSAGGGR